MISSNFGISINCSSNSLSDFVVLLLKLAKLRKGQMDVSRQQKKSKVNYKVSLDWDKTKIEHAFQH